MSVWRRPFGDLPDIKRLRACANKRPRTTTELFSCQGLQSMSAVGQSRLRSIIQTYFRLCPKERKYCEHRWWSVSCQ